MGKYLNVKDVNIIYMFLFYFIFLFLLIPLSLKMVLLTVGERVGYIVILSIFCNLLIKTDELWGLIVSYHINYHIQR